MRRCNLKESDNIEKLFYCQVRVPYKHDEYSVFGSNYSDYCENDKKFEWVTQKGWYVNYLENFRIDTEPFIEKALKLSKNEWKYRFKNYFEMENPGRFFTFIPAIEEGSKTATVYFEKSRYPGTLSLLDIKADLKKAGLVLNRVEEKKDRYNKNFYKLCIIINDENDLKTLNQFVSAKKDVSEISFDSPNSIGSKNTYELTMDMLESMIMHRDAENEPKLMIAASKMKSGDIVYNEKNGHKLKVVNVDKGGFGRAKITFSDLDNNEKKITRLHDIRDMWELADDGDTAYEVNKDDGDYFMTPINDDPDFIIDNCNRLNEITEYNKTPEITGIGYKVFRVKNGKLYPPMVANPNNEATPIGKWIEAEEGEFAGLSKTGRKQVKSIGGGKTLSYRPGWHLGDIPLAKQFYRTNKETGEKEFPKDFIWAECEYVMDIDYQDEAMAQGITKSGKFQHSLAGLPKVPKDGYYKYRTNPNPDTEPWVITGAIKINKLLDDYDVAGILKKHGIEAPNRQGGNKTLKELGF